MTYSTWTELSIQRAMTSSYLDDLFKIYPISEPRPRQISTVLTDKIKESFNKQDNLSLISNLLELEKFPFNDAYVSFIRSFPQAIEKNPKTINRLAGRCYELGLENLLKSAEKPKESNTQMGPLFKEWIKKGTIGLPLHQTESEFNSDPDNCIYLAPDNQLKEFAKEHCKYTIDKGLDLVAKINGTFILGEAKFVTAEGGNQRNQLKITRQLLDDTTIQAHKVAILDGIIYLPKHEKLLKLVTNKFNSFNVLSALELRDFRYSL